MNSHSLVTIGSCNRPHEIQGASGSPCNFKVRVSYAILRPPPSSRPTPHHRDTNLAALEPPSPSPYGVSYGSL